MTERSLKEVVFPSGLTLPQLKKLSTSQLYKVLSEDLLAFGVFMFPNLIQVKYYEDGIPEFQKEIVSLLRRAGNEYFRLCIIAPRSFSKSALISRLYALQLMLFRKVNSILLATHTFSLASKHLAFIKRQLEDNQLIKQYFGNLKPKRIYSRVQRKWSESDMETASNCIISARGSGQRVRGMLDMEFRPKCIIIDDPESRENTKTKESMNRNLLWLHAEVQPALADDGWIILCGNYIKPGCMVHRKQRNPEWKSVIYSALGKNGKSIWESKIPTDRLLKIKSDYEFSGDYDTFPLEYMNDAKSSSKRRFDPDEYRFWIGEVYIRETKYLIIKRTGEYATNSDMIMWRSEKQGMRKAVEFYLGVDLAISDKELADYNSFSTIARDTERNIFDVDEELLKTNKPSDIVDKIIDKYRKYKYKKVAIETNGFQLCIKEDLKEECNKFADVRNLKGKVDGLENYGEKKTARILGTIQPKFRSGRIHLRCKDEKKHSFRHIVDQFDGFPFLEHDDALDSFEFAVRISKPARIEESRVLIHKPLSMTTVNTIKDRYLVI